MSPRRRLFVKGLKARDAAEANRLEAALIAHARDRRALPGAAAPQSRAVLVRQLIDSVHRVRYPGVIAKRPVSPRRADPAATDLFDPIRAAVHYHRLGDFDEACWMVFLFVHFGRHPRGGYRYTRDVYGRLGDGGRWDWAAVTADPPAFSRWVGQHQMQIRTTGGPGGFGNHRKRETLQPSGTGRTVETYVAWVNSSVGHRARFNSALAAVGGDGSAAFASLYDSMSAVFRFGRTARFDYLTMLGKLGLVGISPGSTFLRDATGPLRGARLLYGAPPGTRASTLEDWLRELDGDLQVGAQVLEDAICNWQKEPDRYRSFRG